MVDSRQGEGGEGGVGGAGGDPSGTGGTGGQGGAGGASGPRSEHRSVRLRDWAVGIAAALAVVASIIAWVQAEQNRDAVARVETQQDIITANAAKVAIDAAAAATAAADVAAYVAELRARPPAATSPQAVAEAFATIPRIGLAVERLTGEPLPQLPTTTTTAG